MSNPVEITGGCLCQKIRYTATFNADQWPPKSDTCQCTMCRKFTGALVNHFLAIGAEQITPSLSTFATYREYPSSPGRYRGFCGECGSSLIWRSEFAGESFDLLLGCVDERWLVGEGTGKLLCTPSGEQFWYENAIPGVSDLARGGRVYQRTRPGAGQ